MRFDRSATTTSNRLGVLLSYEDGDTIPLSFKLGFSCSNNATEYEAYLTRKNRLGVYQGSRKGKLGRSATPCDSPYMEPEEPSPSEGLGVHSLLLREEEEAIRAISDGK